MSKKRSRIARWPIMPSKCPTPAAAAIAFARIERHHHVAAFPNSFASRVDSKADTVAESPDADEPIQMSVRCRKTRGQDVGVVVDVHRRGDSVFAQRLHQQLLYIGALQLAEIGRLLDETAVDDARQSDPDRVHGLSRRHGQSPREEY